MRGEGSLRQDGPRQGQNLGRWTVAGRNRTEVRQERWELDISMISGINDEANQKKEGSWGGLIDDDDGRVRGEKPRDARFPSFQIFEIIRLRSTEKSKSCLHISNNLQNFFNYINMLQFDIN